MTTDSSYSSVRSKGLLYGLGLAVLWAVLAGISPTTTYHLAPLIVASAPAIVDSLQGNRSMVRFVLNAAVGLAMALTVTGILSASGVLDGPSLLPTGGAVMESVVFAVAGGVVGLVGALLISRP